MYTKPKPFRITHSFIPLLIIGIFSLMTGAAFCYSDQTPGNAGIVVEAPIPQSEYSEKTGPNQITFLAYPKYYKTSDGTLTPVNTTLVPSKDPEWDYEVTAGIWTLKVRKDGTFQAQHKGDIFTYRLNSLGVGRGSKYQPFKGEPNFSNVQVIGDTIRWNEVFPNADLSVRYINDILKVDVIVKKERVNEINAMVQKGELNKEDFLTARFDIPQVLILSQAMLGNEKQDLYAERFELGAMPLQFEKDGKTVHKLRPIEIQIEDDNGKAIQPYNDPKLMEKLQSVKTAQAWQLSKEGAGIAEMSMSLADLAGFEDVNVVIDPNTTFFGASLIFDTFLVSATNINYSTSQSLELYTNTKNILIGVDVEVGLGKLIGISTAEINLHKTYFNEGTGTWDSWARAYQVTRDCTNSLASWNTYNGTLNWTTGGGDCNQNFSRKVKLNGTTPQTTTFDVTHIMRAQYYENNSYPKSRGFLIKEDLSSSSGCAVTFGSIENQSPGLRPTVSIEYFGCPYSGTDIGYGVDLRKNLGVLDANNNLTSNYSKGASPVYGVTVADTTTCITGINADHSTTSFRVNEVNNDKLSVIRNFFAGYDNDRNILENAWQKQKTVIIVFGVGGGYANPQAFGNQINTYLQQMMPPYATRNYIATGTLAAIEIGNEELGKWIVTPQTPEPDITDANYWTGGKTFASYYVEGMKSIRYNSSHPEWKKLEILSGGSFIDDKQFHTNPALLPNQGDQAFLRGFIYGVLQSGAQDGEYYNYLPDTVTVHRYNPNIPQIAEDFSNPGRPWGKYSEALKGLYSTCQIKGYYPNFGITEYLCTATSTTSNPSYQIVTSGPLNITNAYTQATYYLMAKLAHATMGGCNSKFKYDLIYQQVTGSRAWCWDTQSNICVGDVCSFYNYDFDYPSFSCTLPGSDKPIRYVAREIHSPNGLLRLNSAQFVPWQSLNVQTDIPLNAPYNSTGWCGWKLSTPENNYSPEKNCWLAIWRYCSDVNFYTGGNTTQTIRVNGNYTSSAQYTISRYRFTILYDQYWTTMTVNNPMAIFDIYGYKNRTDSNGVSLTKLNDESALGFSITYDQPNKQTVVTVPYVNENPTFIHFTKN